MIQEDGHCLANGPCNKATNIAIPSTTEGSTDSIALVDFVRYQIPTECVEGQGFINTQWYTFTPAQAQMVQVSAFWEGFEPPILALYTGTCPANRLKCATLVDRAPTSFGSLKFCGDYDERLFLMVAGNNDHREPFLLFTDYIPTSCSNIRIAHSCTEANLIQSLPHQSFGDFSGEPLLLDIGCNHPSNFAGTSLVGRTWYKIIGTGRRIEADSAATQGNLKFVVYKDSCMPDDCIAFTPDTGSKSVWCGEPGVEYFVLLATIGQDIVANFQVSFENLEVCVGVPERLRVITASKSQDSLTFAWDEPFSFGFPVLRYSYEFSDMFGNFINVQGNTTDTQVTFNHLPPGEEFRFIVSAANKFGVGEQASFTEETSRFGCVSESTMLLNSSTVFTNFNLLHANLISPSSDAESLGKGAVLDFLHTR